MSTISTANLGSDKTTRSNIHLVEKPYPRQKKDSKTATIHNWKQIWTRKPRVSGMELILVRKEPKIKGKQTLKSYLSGLKLLKK